MCGLLLLCWSYAMSAGLSVGDVLQHAVGRAHTSPIDFLSRVYGVHVTASVVSMDCGLMTQSP